MFLVIYFWFGVIPRKKLGRICRILKTEGRAPLSDHLFDYFQCKLISLSWV